MLPDINSYIQTPGKLDNQSLTVLSELIKKYPFFQTARLLHIKNIQNVRSKIDKNELNLIASYVSDRKILYYLLHKFHGSPQKEDSITDRPQPIAVEKEIKDSLKENISSTLHDQLTYYELSPSAEIELIPGLAIDIRKEYGEGIELDDTAYSINNFAQRTVKGKDFFELVKPSDEISHEDMHETEQDVNPSSTELKEFYKDTPVDFIDEDILSADEVSDKTVESSNDIAYDKLSEKNIPASKESHSFTSWLNTIDKDSAKTESVPQSEDLINIEGETTEPESPGADEQKNSVEKSTLEPVNKNFQGSLIDKFIETNPRIVPRAENIKNEDISKESVKENEGFFTDTLAQIYIKQGHYAKAIFAYEKLSLKYPEKSAYFAGQISEIKKLINNS